MEHPDEAMRLINDWKKIKILGVALKHV